MNAGMSVKRNNSIDEAASAWLVSRQSPTWSAADQHDFDEWLTASTYHRIAFLRLELAWEDAARLKALGAGIASDRPPPRGRWKYSPYFGSWPAVERHESQWPAWRLRNLGIAASVLLVVGVLAIQALTGKGKGYSTPVGEISTVAIADGTQMTLNTNSRVRVALSASERHVELNYGEAFFHVSKDPTRPFVVEAGGKRVIAVGTQFSVRREGSDVEIVVTEGRVRVEDAGTAELTPGSIAHADDAGILVKRASVSEAEERLSWRSGWLALRDQTLADAIAEFNRYNKRQVVVRDRAVSSLRIEGNFRANDVDAFVRLLATEFPVKASSEGELVVIEAR